MGRFVYDSSIRVELEDRLLAHIQAVVMAKVRRGEGFCFTWKDDVSTGGGRTSVYIHPGVSLVFKYHGGRTPQLNTAWLQALTYNANSSRGLYIVSEPEGTPLSTVPGKEMVFGEISAPDPRPSGR